MSTTIAERLLALRESEGLALRPFAERLAAAGFPISAATVGGYENGRTEKVPADYLAAVCQTFGSNPEWLLLGEGPVRRPPVETAAARLEAVRAALEAPPPEAHDTLTFDPGGGSGAEPDGTRILIELVAAFEQLIPGGRARRADAVRLADHIATRLADARILAAEDHRLWQTYLAGAAPGPAGIPPEVVLADVLNDDLPTGRSLQALLVGVGERLTTASSYELAADCHGLAFLAAERAGDIQSACDAARRRGLCDKLLARWPEALEWYERAMALAERAGDWERYGLVLSGLAWLRFDQGAMADAQRIGERLIAMGEERGVPICVAEGHQMLSAVAQLGGRFHDGIWHGWRAAVTSPSPDGRLRALFSTGTSLLEAGHLDGAEDAYRLAASGIKDLSTRALAMSALAYVAAMRGDGDEFDRRQERFEAMSRDHVSRRDRAQILYFQAKALALLGRLDEARRGFQDAVLFAERHGFHREAIRADEALALLKAEPNPWPRSEPIASNARLEEVHEGLRKMIATGVRSHT